jgi:hypothetical protein
MKINLKLRIWVFACLVLAVAILMALMQPAGAHVSAQAAYFTPTAGSDGRILYTVKSGDTCLSISLLTGVSLDQLRKFNNLQADCTIYPNQKLLLGMGGPSVLSPTPGPSPTATPILPTPTPPSGVGQICVVLYNDINGNSLHEAGEPDLPDSAISLTDTSGKVSKTGMTTADDTNPTCFDKIPEGDYNVSVAIPEGYNATTEMSSSIHLQAGDSSTFEFGVQLSAKAVPPTVSEGGHSPILGILGGVVVLLGLGLGIYVLRMPRKTPPGG